MTVWRIVTAGKQAKRATTVTVSSQNNQPHKLPSTNQIRTVCLKDESCFTKYWPWSWSILNYVSKYNSSVLRWLSHFRVEHFFTGTSQCPRRTITAASQSFRKVSAHSKMCPMSQPRGRLSSERSQTLLSVERLSLLQVYVDSGATACNGCSGQWLNIHTQKDSST